MTDKVKKIREEVARLYNQSLADENRQADIGLERAANVSYGKSKACKELLSFIDSLQEEPVSEDFTKALAECIHKAQCSVVDPMAHAEIWKDELIKLAKCEEPVSTKDKLLALSDGRLHLGWIDDAKVVEFEECLMQFHEDMNNIPQGTDSLTRLKDTDGVLHSYSKKLMSMPKEEPVSEDLGEYINELSKQFPEVSFAKLSRIAVRVAKWQKEQFEKNRLAHCDAQTEEEAEIELDFVMSIIEKEHRQPTFDDAIKYGMNLQKEQMLAKAIDGRLYSTICGSEQNVVAYVGYGEYGKDGDKVKVIVIKED